MTEEQETTKSCSDCGRTIYQGELCVCKQDKSNSTFKNTVNWCPDCNNAGYVTRNNKITPCTNLFHNQ